jgi:hypothetical protein
MRVEIFVGKHRLVKRAQCVLAGEGLAIVNDGSVIGKEIHPALQTARGCLSGKVDIGLPKSFSNKAGSRAGFEAPMAKIISEGAAQEQK